MSYGQTDELSFGDDREPWLRTWARAHLRMLLITSVALALGAGLGTGGWFLYQRSLLPSPPPDEPFPLRDRVAIMLCPGDGAECRTDTLENVAHLARGIPELTSVTPVTEAEAERRWRDTAIVPDPGTDEDATWIPYIEAKLRSPADFESVRRRLTDKPGVWRVAPHGTDFWAGKAHLAVYLCPRRGLAPCRESPATKAQRDAVATWLRGQDGVEEVFLEDKAFRLRLVKHYTPDARITADDIPETLYVRLDDPVKARERGEALVGRPGVGWVRLVK